jgi:hypothetical protein
LTRLAVLADKDHHLFTRAGGRPEFADRRVAVVLAQGAAQHFLDCLEGARRPNGVNDLDVWTFYAAIPGTRFPADRRKRVEDFGPSALGRNRFDFAKANDSAQLARWKKWDRFEGRRVDLMVRPLPIDPDATPDDVVGALRAWLQAGAGQPASARRSNWYLSQRAVVLIHPGSRLGEVVWPWRRRS